jgi:hypothetical protein
MNNAAMHMTKRELTTDMQIKAFLHCGKCLKELVDQGGGSPRDYARLSVGWTAKGFQVWCNRHDCNVMHVDFEGRKHPAV